MGKTDNDSFWDIDELLPESAVKKARRLTAARDTTAVDVDIRTAVVQTGERIPPVGEAAAARKPSETASLSYELRGCLIQRVEIFPWPTKLSFYESFRQDALRYFRQKGEPCAYVPFSVYMPQYNQMSRSQFEYYLYWREQVCRGVYPKTDLNYLLLHIYEIINLPDRVSPTKGMRHMARLWAAYRDTVPYLDKYLGESFCDYCLVHRVAPDFDIIGPFAGEVASRVSMPEFYLRDGNIPWDVIRSLSSYEYSEGHFYEANAEFYDRYIPAAVEHLVNTYVAPRLADYGVKPVHVQRDSFSGVAVCCRLKSKMTVVCTPLRRSPELKQTITGIIKLCENHVRAAVGVKSRFSPGQISSELKEKVAEYFNGIFPKPESKKRKSDAQLEEEAYLALYEPKENGPADIGRAMEIEAAAWEIAELLHTDDEDAGQETAAIAAQDTEREVSIAVVMPSEETILSAETAPVSEGEEFAFLSLMDDFLRKALGAAAQGRFDAFCREHGKLAHTVCAEINEFAAESFGDTILDEGDFSLIPDYEAQLCEALGVPTRKDL